jgi:hypothetical protein
LQGAQDSEELKRRRAAYEKFLRRGLLAEARGSTDDALFWLTAAAALAWLYPFDKWSEPALDSALERIALALPQREAIEPRPDRLVHLASLIIDGGGHVELLMLMLEHLEGFEQFLVSSEWANNSRQAGAATLEALSVPVSLCPSGLRPTQKVRWVFDQLAETRPARIVLTVQPGDLFGLAACLLYRRASGAEFMLMNQGETYFWCGSAQFDRVIEWREAGAHISAGLRGVANERLRIVRPISRPKRSPDVERAALGVPDDATVSLTVAGYHKLKPDGHFDYAASIRRLLEEHPGHFHLMVGYGEGEEALRRELTTERVKWLGRRSDIDALLRVADFVIESFPLGTGMFRLDTAREGRPMVSNSHPAWPLVFDTGAFPPDYPFRAGSNEEILRHSRRLIADASLRRCVGDDLKQWYEQRFSPKLYADALNEAVRGRGAAPPPPAPEVLERDAEWFSLLFNPASVSPREHLWLIENLLGHTPTPNAPERVIRLARRVRASVRHRLGI